jgi:acetyl-CoA acetyltransferase
VDEVLASRPIASPLKVLDCCPVSDGGCAVLGRRAA